MGTRDRRLQPDRLHAQSHRPDSYFLHSRLDHWVRRSRRAHSLHPGVRRVPGPDRAGRPDHVDLGNREAEDRRICRLRREVPRELLAWTRLLPYYEQTLTLTLRDQLGVTEQAG
jgi:hypothetical protein